MKVKTVIEKDRNFKITKFYVNDIFICECKVGGDYFHTFKNLTPSRIRDKWKKTYHTTWIFSGLKELLVEYNLDDFKNDYPNFRSDYQGSIITKKKLTEKLQKYFAN